LLVFAPLHRRRLVFLVRPSLSVVAILSGPWLAAVAPGRQASSRWHLDQLRGRPRQVRLPTAASVVAPVAVLNIFILMLASAPTLLR